MLATANRNLQLYNQPDVVACYEQATELMPPETYVFSKYVPQGADILDIGVGAGRTTAFLAPRAGRYVGLDYAEAMLAVCKNKYPELEFVQADATDLSDLESGSFDIAIFSFNGIDCIPSDEGRVACLREMRRVVRSDGLVVISSHNAKVLAEPPQFHGAGTLRACWRLLRSPFVSAKLAYRMLRSRAYYDGDGFILDPVHGGLLIHVSTPRSIQRDASFAGLAVVEVVNGFHPRQVAEMFNPWNTYVMRKIAT